MSKHSCRRGARSPVKLLLGRILLALFGISVLATATAQDVSTAPHKVPDPSDAEVTQPIALVAQTSPLAPAVPALTAPAKPAAEDVNHRIAHGETLGKIVKKYDANIDCVADANGITNRNRIHETDNLRIPQGCLKGGKHPGPKAERAPPPAEKKSAPASASDSGSGKADRAVQIALSKVGARYVYGAEGPNSFDCSGLMLWAFKQVGVNLPRTSGAMSGVGERVSRDELRPGDLVFFYKPVSHVAMYIGDNKIVHASTKKKPVRVVEMSDYYNRNFNGARRVV